MFQLVLILFLCGFTVAQEKRLLCRSDDLDIFYSYCGTGINTFSFKAEPCSLKGHSVWKGIMFWIPKADLTILTGRVALWHKGLLSLKWDVTLCHGVDDDYSFCGTLKGETINTTVRISSRQPDYKQGEYMVIFEGFSGHFENFIVCMNYTFVIKQRL
ncbi:lymphocyte antigen 96 [Elgaria multicarinata webbii]|uniref:lymphocyte antigen 96 n=1 Tax=Elgaria multicarinata webbii TaxID=159646 RepID=UPI002FCCCDE7